jgi:hypothetical protein
MLSFILHLVHLVPELPFENGLGRDVVITAAASPGTLKTSMPLMV